MIDRLLYSSLFVVRCMERKVVMSQIMNHREIEYFTKKYWELHGIESKMTSDMFMTNDRSRELMKWLDNTLEDVIDEDLAMDYGLDCLRCYLLFEKTPRADDPYFDSWDEGGLEGVYKFVSKYRRMILTALEANAQGQYSDTDVTKMLHTIDMMKKDCCKYLQKDNTLPNRHNILSILMEGCKNLQKELKIGEITLKEHHHEIETAIPLNEQIQNDNVDKIKFANQNDMIYELCRKIVIVIAPFVPYISEELWQSIDLYEKRQADALHQWYDNKQSTSVLEQKWTTEGIDMESENIKLSIPVQVNAKTRRIIDITYGMTREQVEMIAKNEISRYLKPGIDYDIIYIPNKLINFIIK